MLLLNGILILWLAVVILFLVTIAYGALSAAPWVPMPPKDIVRFLSVAGLKRGEIIYELGCADGRVLLAAARLYGVKAIGFEVAVLPYLIAQLRRVFSSYPKEVTIYYRSFWSVDLNQADAVFCFLMPAAMKKLAPKVKAELKPGARVVSYVFKLPEVAPSITSRPDEKAATIYLYRF